MKQYFETLLAHLLFSVLFLYENVVACSLLL
jgi:hypothetical protein